MQDTAVWRVQTSGKKVSWQRFLDRYRYKGASEPQIIHIPTGYHDSWRKTVATYHARSCNEDWSRNAYNSSLTSSRHGSCSLHVAPTCGLGKDAGKCFDITTKTWDESLAGVSQPSVVNTVAKRASSRRWPLHESDHETVVADRSAFTTSEVNSFCCHVGCSSTSDIDHTLVSCSQPMSRELVLDKLINFGSVNLDPCNIIPDLYELTESCSFYVSPVVPDWDDLHPFSKLALEMAHPFDLRSFADPSLAVELPSLKACYVFTDGSFKDGCASWGFCVVLKFAGNDHDAFRFAGSSAGEVVVDQNHVRYLGAKNLNNYSGELCALAHALLFVLQFKYIHSVPVQICFDCEPAAQVVQGFSDVLSEESLVAVSRLLLDLVWFAQIDLSFHHVRGHSGNPWNEIADKCCVHLDWNAYSRAASLPALPFARLLRAGTHAMFHAVDVFVGRYLRRDMPPLVGTKLIFSSGNASSKSPGASWSLEDEQVVSANAGGSVIKLHFMQYNALTFYPSQHGSDDHGYRVPYIQQHLVKQGVNIAGFQETRTSGPAIRTLKCFYSVASGAVKGHRGCEVWVSRSLCAKEDLNIAYSSDRCVLVTIRSSTL